MRRYICFKKQAQRQINETQRANKFKNRKKMNFQETDMYFINSKWHKLKSLLKEIQFIKTQIINSSINEKNKQINKMQRSPKYKPIEINSAKDRQKYFKNLYDEVNKSRMAVETITSFKNTEMNFKKKIDQIQQELHSSMSRMNLETKRNVILKQLNTLMKGEMFNFQKTQKREEEKTESEIQKKIKKVQYDIQQILQKHNEQIAKITSLKESAMSGRSQRVVFSNLFKKLEKQIKQNEELYKQNLTKSQIAKDKSKLLKPTSRVLEKDSTEVILQNSRHSQTNIDIFPMDSKFANSGDHDGAFITLQRERSFDEEKKRTFLHQKELSHGETFETKNSSKCFIDKISSYENFIEKIKVFMGFYDIEEGISFYRTLQNSNQNLASQIQTFNEQLSDLEHAIREVAVQKRRSDCYEKFKELPMGSSRRIKSSTESFVRNEDSSQELTDTLLEISKILNLEVSNNDFNEDMLKTLDGKLDMILEETKMSDLFSSDENANNNRATTATTEGNLVDILLQKMDRFGQCEKILDKIVFKQEYTKQLGRSKKHKSKK